MISLTFYGGVGEIGGNKFLLELDDTSLFLDFGLSFGAEGQFFEQFLRPRSGSKLHDLLSLSLLPKLNGIYREDALCPEGLLDLKGVRGRSLWETGIQSYEKAVEDSAWHPDAVFISHAHLDHCGYVPFLGDIPLVCSKTTKTLLEAISDIGNLSGFDNELVNFERRRVSSFGKGYFPGELKIDTGDAQERRISTLSHRESLSVGSGVEMTLFDVGHSIPGSSACLVESKQGQVVYTGDLRFHGRSGHNLGDELAGLKPDVMICEGTRIDKEEPDDEEQVERDLAEKFEETSGLVIVAFAWKDLERYETVKKAALSTDRIPVFDPRLAYLKARLGKSVYQEGAKVFLERSNSMLYSPGDYVRSKHKAGEISVSEWSSKSGVKDTVHLKEGVAATELRENGSEYVLHLDYYRFKNLVEINPPKGTVFIRAHAEPFNPEMELSSKRLKNWLKHFKINPNMDYEPVTIHASGHASGPEILEMIQKIKPKQLFPIHTKSPQLFTKATSTSAVKVVLPEKEKAYKGI